MIRFFPTQKQYHYQFKQQSQDIDTKFNLKLGVNNMGKEIK